MKPNVLGSHILAAAPSKLNPAAHVGAVAAAGFLVAVLVPDVAGNALAQETDCLNSVSVNASASQIVPIDSSIEAVRPILLRRALKAAVQKGAGLEITASSRSSTITENQSIRQETIEKIGTRTSGRLESWSVLEETTELLSSSEKRIDLTVQAGVCKSPEYVPTMIVAFDPVDIPSEYARAYDRDRLAHAFQTNGRIMATLTSPKKTYYDVLVKSSISIETEIVDNAKNIAILKRFSKNQEIPPLPQEMKIAKVTIVANAERYYDEMSLTEIIELKKYINTNTNERSNILNLISEAIDKTSTILYKKLSNGKFK